MRTRILRRTRNSLTSPVPSSASKLRLSEGESTELCLPKRNSAQSSSPQKKGFPVLIGSHAQAPTSPFSKSCSFRLQSPTPLPYSITITPPSTAFQAPKQATSPKKGPGGHIIDTVKALELASRLPRPSEVLITSSKVPLPPAKRPQTIVFDLEETLVHICEHKASAEVLVNGGALGFNIRPYAVECLLALRKQWEIIVFASSEKDRAEAVLDYLDPSRRIIDYRLYRSQALLIQDVLVKDLRLLAGRDLRRTVIVDNTASAFAFQLDSGIPIKTWRNSKQDTELLKLLDFMTELLQESDMRLRLRKTFDLAHLKEDFAKAFSLSE